MAGPEREALLAAYRTSVTGYLDDARLLQVELDSESLDRLVEIWETAQNVIDVAVVQVRAGDLAAADLSLDTVIRTSEAAFAEMQSLGATACAPDSGDNG